MKVSPRQSQLSHLIRLLLMATVAIGGALPLRAEVLFRMGEDDPGSRPDALTSFTLANGDSKLAFRKINANPRWVNNTPQGLNSTLALEFFGSHGGVLLEEDLLADSGGRFVVDGWYLIHNGDAGTLFQFGAYGFDGFVLYCAGGNIWGAYQSASDQLVEWDTKLETPVGNWSRITMAFDGTRFRVFLNGREGEGHPANDLVSASDIVVLGNRQAFQKNVVDRGSFDTPMEGIIDEWTVGPFDEDKLSLLKASSGNGGNLPDGR